MKIKNKYKLSICVITMNRREQLIEALTSCLLCKMPKDTQFVIVDNGSTDNTENDVKNLLNKCEYDYIYQKSPINLGVGGGRNLCYNLSTADYLYFLDDDAIISPQSYQSFFDSNIKFLDRNPQVATITTKIIDKFWPKARIPLFARSKQIEGRACIFMYFGGSHFIRRSAFQKRENLYDDIKYGFEELAPSLYAMDIGFYNVYDEKNSILHCPKINKWEKGSEELYNLQVLSCTTPYFIKKEIYPTCFFPLIYLAYKLRCMKYLKKSSYKKTKYANINITQKFKVQISTIFDMLFQFGFSIF